MVHDVRGRWAPWVPCAILALGCDGTVVLGRGDAGCEPVTCEMYCELGFAKGPDGCEICACVEAPCAGPSPAGCSATGCASGEVCDTTASCVPSSCTCDSQTASWVCTEDCGGGTCVPEPACTTPDPSGCASTGCEVGKVCDTAVGCYPSSCACDAASNTWACTEDCGGGICVEDSECGPNPAGCIAQGCPAGYDCDTSVGCLPSSCVCDPGSGWGCTDDCSGGTCVLAR